jgi:type VI secretion system secreted protein Hcp
METAIYLKTPSIQGDVTEQNHKQWIKISKLTFSANRKIKSEPGNIANRESTRPAISQLTVTKPMDCASSLLFGEACTGKAQSQISIDICKTGHSGLSTIATFALENAVVSGYHLDTDAPQSKKYAGKNNTTTAPLETVTFSFDKIEMKITPYGPQGEQRTPISYAYDMKTAAPA